MGPTLHVEPIRAGEELRRLAKRSPSMRLETDTPPHAGMNPECGDELLTRPVLRKTSMLIRLLKFILLLLVFWSHCSCSANTGYQKVRSSTERFTLEGVSLFPPEGEGWYFKKDHPGSLQFGKRGEGKNQSIGAVILAL